MDAPQEGRVDGFSPYGGSHTRHAYGISYISTLEGITTQYQSAWEEDLVPDDDNEEMEDETYRDCPRITLKKGENMIEMSLEVVLDNKGDRKESWLCLPSLMNHYFMETESEHGIGNTRK